MNLHKTLVIFQALIFSLYLSWWFGYIVPSNIGGNHSQYWYIGLSGFVLLGIAAIRTYLNIPLKKWLYIVLLVGLMSCTLLYDWVSPEDDFIVLTLLVLISILQGLIISVCINRWYQPTNKNNLLHILILGLPLVLISHFFDKKQEMAFDPFYYLNVLLILLLILTEFFRKEEASSITYKQPSQHQLQKGVNIAVYLLAMILVALEILFIYWSLLLSNDNQGVVTALTFPSTMVLVFLWRIKINKFLHKLSDLGWMFVLTIVLTLSIGLFYTFGFTVPFILGFSLSTASLIFIHNRIFSFVWDKNRIAVVLLICALSSLICGFYIQNHIDFIKSIEMPDDVLVLSARQAIVKEFASFAGLTVVLSGYLFLKRRSFRHLIIQK